MVWFWASFTKHGTKQIKRRLMVLYRGISSNHSGVEVDVGEFETVKNEASIVKVVELEKATANQFEGVEIGLRVAEDCQKGLELFKVIEMIAF
ncbi:hypothetical protein OIU84_017507 [Salix udensis]|uniref:Uncharacterized protein n=1 Tax=Salix udensis TaxID=889485 RepID=A0AAD6L206_9ROSI|nr:hypothetical protein OIU84_017507 [Salix udensis]